MAGIGRELSGLLRCRAKGCESRIRRPRDIALQSLGSQNMQNYEHFEHVRLAFALPLMVPRIGAAKRRRALPWLCLRAECARHWRLCDLAACAESWPRACACAGTVQGIVCMDCRSVGIAVDLAPFIPQGLWQSLVPQHVRLSPVAIDYVAPLVPRGFIRVPALFMAVRRHRPLRSAQLSCLGHVSLYPKNYQAHAPKEESTTSVGLLPDGA
ncbi:hypothetical protein AK812_SmicGene11827 [Symbiodinium microadriaticum]|uniref:Uncharacterized protein n=1 Tax=Symbiodinium microadriaticum TaxID=2951 RepID=A0A1Q9ECE7_SYMMI|nr:hypothetical protein AK812_SmicGene11827 [Symbiodinium microadriaticum]